MTIEFLRPSRAKRCVVDRWRIPTQLGDEFTDLFRLTPLLGQCFEERRREKVDVRVGDFNVAPWCIHWFPN
jgi:hypothetical protein